jgi:hypothetical protein
VSGFKPKPTFCSQSDAQTAATYLGPNLRSHSCCDQLVFRLVQGARPSTRTPGDLVSRDFVDSTCLGHCALPPRGHRGRTHFSNQPEAYYKRSLSVYPQSNVPRPRYSYPWHCNLGRRVAYDLPIALFATANWVHIPFEEAKMSRQFGAAYDDYVARVWRSIAKWLNTNTVTDHLMTSSPQAQAKVYDPW